MKTETEFSIRLLNSKSNTNTAFTKPYRALPMTVRTKIHQAALDREDSFRDGTRDEQRHEVLSAEGVAMGALNVSRCSSERFQGKNG